MPSTYSTNLKLELMANGEQSGTWGTTTNTNLGTLLEEAITGVGSVTMADADTTISIANGASSAARKIILNVTGTLTAARNLIVPTIDKTYIVYNNTTGSQTITVKTAAGSGIAIPAGQKRSVYVDSVNVNEAINSVGNLNVNGNLSATGNATITGSLSAGSFSIGGYTLTLNNNTTLTTSGVTNVTLPTTGTLATLAGTETFTNKTITSPTINTPIVSGGTFSGAGLTNAVLTTSTLNAAPTAGDSSLAIACTSFIQQALAALVPTGSIMPYAGGSAPSGWILSSGGTIGNATSGANLRANADTQSLFTLLYNSWADAQAPVSGGRTGNATNDFNNGKTIQVPDLRGRVIAGLDNMGGSSANRLYPQFNSGVIGATGGDQTNTATTNSNGTNTIYTTSYSMDGPSTLTPVTGGGGQAGGVNHTHANVLSVGTPNISVTGTSSAFGIVQPTMVMNYIIKL